MPQAILSETEIDRLLSVQRIVRVAFSAAGDVYLLPLGYVWRDGCLCLIMTQGKKTAMARAQPRVAFQVDDAAERGLTGWSSVTGNGVVEFVQDETEIAVHTDALLARFPELAHWSADEYRRRSLAGELRFVRIRPDRMTGRRFSGE